MKELLATFVPGGAAALTGCQTTTSRSQTGAALSSQSETVSVQEGARSIKELYFDTRPDVTGFEAAVAKQPFTKVGNSNYVHERLGLTTKLWGTTPEKCSVGINLGDVHLGKHYEQLRRNTFEEVPDVFHHIRSTQTEKGTLFPFSVRGD